jgi:lipid-binding SYLF domain-containing protein
MKILSSLLILVFLWAANATAADTTSQQELLKDAKSVMEEIMSTPDLQIPKGLISKAKAVIIFPSMFKGGFFVGARYGNGVAAVRDSQTGFWGPPSFITTLGGSFGFQFGAQAVDLVLLVMSERGIKGVLENNFTLGGDLSVTVGPVGRYAELGVDILLQGDMYSYSRSQGIFGGVSLKGTVIKPNLRYNKGYYDAEWTPQEIMMGGAVKQLPKSSMRLIKYLNQMAPPKKAVDEKKVYQDWTDNPKYGLAPGQGARYGKQAAQRSLAVSQEGFKPRVMAQNAAPRQASKPARQPRKPSSPLW